MKTYRVFNKWKQNERGVSAIEMILLIATIGILISVIAPWFKMYMAGKTDPVTGEKSGFINSVIQNQTRGVNEISDAVQLIPGCDTNLVEYIVCQEIGS